MNHVLFLMRGRRIQRRTKHACRGANAPHEFLSRLTPLFQTAGGGVQRLCGVRRQYAGCGGKNTATATPSMACAKAFSNSAS